MTCTAQWGAWGAVSAALFVAGVFVGLEYRPKPEPPTRRADGGQAPSPEVLAELAGLRTSERKLRRELAMARQRADKKPPTALAPGPRTESEEEEIGRCALSLAPSCALSPSDALLEHRARCGVVVYDLPEAFDEPEPDLAEWVDSVGLEPIEQEILKASNRIFHEVVRDGFSKAYLELGGVQPGEGGVQPGGAGGSPTRKACFCRGGSPTRKACFCNGPRARSM